MQSTKPKNILITYGRSFLALQLARQLKACGHNVYTADSMHYHLSSFSNAVVKNFYVPSPRYHSKAYINELIKIIETEKIDLLIPIYEEISYISKVRHRFPVSCELFLPDFKLYDKLQNKWKFQILLQEHGFDTLKNHLISTHHDLKEMSFKTPFALKACYSRASQRVRKILPDDSLADLDFDSHNPWLAQEWLDGDRFCSYSVCHQGKVHAHAVYPVGYAIEGNSCIAFESINHPPINEWINQLIQKIDYTGQIAFDFIVSKDQKIFAIECNPRATSGILLFDRKNSLEKAFFRTNQEILYPKPGSRRQIAFGMLMYGWKKNALPNNRLHRFIWDFCRTKDVIFSLKDLKPFLLEPFIFGNIFMNSRKSGMSVLDSFIHDHEWNGEPLIFDANEI